MIQKWEYCTIYPVWMDYQQGWLIPGDPDIHGYIGEFKSDSVWREKLEKDPRALAISIAKLGQEGWELVGCGNVDREHCLYFKRPIVE